MKLSKQSANVALLRYGSSCICGCGRPARHWHHIFDQQHYPELGDEPDNVVPVASICHGRHHSASRRLPRAVCRFAERLAVNDSMRRYLERVYR